MAIYYLVVLFAVSLVRMECRSIICSNFNEAGLENHEASKENLLSNTILSKYFDNVYNLTNVDREFVDRSSKDFPENLNRFITTQGLNLEKFLAEFVARSMNITNQEKTAVQWLKQLKLILETLSSGIQNEKSRVDSVNDIEETEPTSHEENKNFILIGGDNWLGDLQEFLDEQYIDTENIEDNESDVKSRFTDSSTSYLLIDRDSEETKDDDRSDQNDPEQLHDVAAEFQNDVGGVQKYFGKLCRKHRTAT